MAKSAELAAMAAIAAGIATALVVDFGYGMTSTMPVIANKCVEDAMHELDIGGR